MITALHNALPVRLTAASSPKACWRHVRRISVGLALFGTLGYAVPISTAADTKKDAGPRIMPATKVKAEPQAPAYEDATPRRIGKPESEVPPLPGEAMPPNGRRQPPQMRIIPGESSSVPNLKRFDQIYRAIPYRRLAYQANPRYREELALSLLFNQFPPPPTYVMPGDSGMGQGGGGPMSSGGPGLGGPPGDPLRWMLQVPPQWLF
jgi:hypothetical protein